MVLVEVFINPLNSLKCVNMIMTPGPNGRCIFDDVDPLYYQHHPYLHLSANYAHYKNSTIFRFCLQNPDNADVGPDKACYEAMEIIGWLVVWLVG